MFIVIIRVRKKFIPDWVQSIQVFNERPDAQKVIVVVVVVAVVVVPGVVLGVGVVFVVVVVVVVSLQTGIALSS